MVIRSSILALLTVASGLLGCSSEAIDDDRDPDEGVAPKLVTLTQVFEPNARVPLSATALAFNAERPDELWLTLRQFPSGLACTKQDRSGCAALEGVAAVVTDATGSTPSAELKQDGNSWHFMRSPMAIAWGEGELFATCGEARTDNFEDEEVPYAGPVLWSSNPEIFGVEPLATQNGTHLDMLHETPYCMGIAHETGNIFWAVNGDAGSLDRYDFHAPHQIGGEDHQDGEVFRYAKGEFSRVEGVPSHAAFDGTTGLVYLADTGHARVLQLDPSTATPGDAIPTYEMLHASGELVGATVADFVPAGLLQRPSGVFSNDGALYVTDNETSLVHVFDLATGRSTQVFDTALPAGSLAGITLGRDGQIYLADLLTGSAYRFEP